MIGTEIMLQYLKPIILGDDDMWTLDQLKYCRESEDKIEFKKVECGSFSYDGGDKEKTSSRRKCILGYVVAFCNENGGTLVFGMSDEYPHKVVGTRQNENSLGELEANIYRDTGIRTKIYELYEDEINKSGRVVVIEIPSRPIGKVFKFEDVSLMRIGEELKPMSDEQYLNIIQEQELDFSQQICEMATIDDLDENAIKIMQQKYAKNKNNESFLSLPTEQILSDLNLIRNNKVTNAAVILLGKESFIKKAIPQSAVILEFRSTEAQIVFDNRIEYHESFFVMIDRLWHDINIRNNSFQVKDGPYIFTIPYFNEEVIREAINNAIAHRDYRITSETIIKQYPQKLTVINAGGFPKGVTKDNLLTVPSTPRNRLLTDVLAKTGIVERSGQGVDKIFYKTLSEGKPIPDYSSSDDFNVELTISAIIQDKAFALFIAAIQEELSTENKLSVIEVVTLAKIKDNLTDFDKKAVQYLIEKGLVEKRGQTRGTRYFLCREYYEFTGDVATYAKKSDWDIMQMMAVIEPFLNKYKRAKMRDFVILFDGHLTRKQVRRNICNLLKIGYLELEGSKNTTQYMIGEKFKSEKETMLEALEIGFKEIQSRNNQVDEEE